MADPKEGDHYGKWELISQAGRGGNAWVWRALNGRSGVEAAVKILKTRKVNREPFKRFRREVEVLGELGERPGVLPILDEHLPEELASRDRAWFVMPLATRLDQALKNSELFEIVTAFAEIAETLADLHEERGLAHRDIKPQNLYEWNGAFVIGDFGLVELPDAEALTEPGTVTGPVNYLPREALQDPDNADWQKIDVFSLAKAFSVVATDQNWPPPGHQPTGGPWAIDNYRPHPRTQLLDRLIEHATRDDPQTRPSMRDVARDLRAWLDLPEATTMHVEMAKVAAEVRAKLAPALAEQGRQEDWRRIALELYGELEQRLQGVREVLGTLPNYRFGSIDPYIGRQLEHFVGTGPEPLVEYLAAMRAEEPVSVLPLQVRAGVALAALDNGDLVVRAMVDVGREGETLDRAWQSDERTAPIESVAASQVIEETVAELEREVPDYLRSFAEQVGPR
jgi:hypothetical protein